MYFYYYDNIFGKSRGYSFLCTHRMFLDVSLNREIFKENIINNEDLKEMCFKCYTRAVITSKGRITKY